MHLEHHRQPLLPLSRFMMRMARYGVIGAAVVLVALGLGVLGYRCFEGMPWLDALLNASLILSGMGPIQPITTTAGKVFASCYALFSGLVLLSVLALLFTPIFHRIMHHIHIVDRPRSRS